MKLNHYSYIDALRGYAILLIIAVHVSQAAPDLKGIGRILVDQGARGVQLFFVASALTLLLSWHTRQSRAAAFYVRRLFRIAPMFWLGIIFFLATEGFGPRYFAPNGIDNLAVFLTVTFLHGWHPETITSVVHGGWSIAVEMNLYLIFPLLSYFIRGIGTAFIGFFASVLLARLSYTKVWVSKTIFYPYLSDDLVSTFLNLWLPNQLPVFMVGFLLYFAIRDYSGRFTRLNLNIALMTSLTLMMILAIKPTLPQLFKVNLYTAYGILFGVFAFCLSQGVGKWFVNLPIRYLGKISFSAYLWHFAFLMNHEWIKLMGISAVDLMDESKGYLFFFQFFIYTLAATTALSTITYRVVERPMVKFGEKLIAKIGLV